MENYVLQVFEESELFSIVKQLKKGQKIYIKAGTKNINGTFMFIPVDIKTSPFNAEIKFNPDAGLEFKERRKIS